MGIRHPKTIFMFRGQTTSFREGKLSVSWFQGWESDTLKLFSFSGGKQIPVLGVSVPAVVCCFTTPPTSSDSNRQTPMPRLQQACTRRVYRWGFVKVVGGTKSCIVISRNVWYPKKSWDNLTVTVSIIQTAEKPLKSWDICEASSSNWCETPIKNGISIIHDLILHQRVYQKHP